MDFTNHKEDILKQAEAFKKKILSQKIELKFYKQSIEAIFNSTKNGKMIRGSLFIEAFEILSSKKAGVNEFKIALALEIFQTSLLIHDDIMDNSMLRRGQPSVIAQYLKEYADIDTASSLAICNGDLGFFLAWEILSEVNSSGEVLQKFAKEFGFVCIAQMTDVDPSKKTGAEVLNLYRYKTARYSFSLPLALASITSDETTKLTALEEIGENIGIVFQIKDDWLDIHGDPEKTGKPKGVDIDDAKQTLNAIKSEKQVTEMVKKIELETLELIDNKLKHKALSRLLVSILYFNQIREG